MSTINAAIRLTMAAKGTGARVGSLRMIRQRGYHPLRMTQIDYVNLIQQFHNLYYQLGHLKQGTWDRTYWMGVPIEKCPCDMWVYQELLFRIRPQLIIETGTRHGGSALFYAQMCDLLGSGEVLTIDIIRGMHFPRHPRLTYLTGSSTDPQIF